MKTMLLTFLVVYNLSNTPKEFKGKVMDISNLEELSGVMVVVNKTDTTYTNFNGDFEFKNISSIKDLDLNYPSYDADNIILIEDSTTIKIDEKLMVKK